MHVRTSFTYCLETRPIFKTSGRCPVDARLPARRVRKVNSDSQTTPVKFDCPCPFKKFIGPNRDPPLVLCCSNNSRNCIIPRTQVCVFIDLFMYNSIDVRLAIASSCSQIDMVRGLTGKAVGKESEEWMNSREKLQVFGGTKGKAYVYHSCCSTRLLESEFLASLLESHCTCC
jgi:hypothetical protein